MTYLDQNGSNPNGRNRREAVRSPDRVPSPLCPRSAATTPRSRTALKTSSLFRRAVIEVRFAIHREQHCAAGRSVVMQRTRFAPDIISGHRQTVVIFDAALQDERLLDLRVFVKGYARAGFEPEEASHLAALGILVEHLDRDFFEAGRLPIHLGRPYVCRAADGRNQSRRSVENGAHRCSLFRLYN